MPHLWQIFVVAAFIDAALYLVLILLGYKFTIRFARVKRDTWADVSLGAEVHRVPTNDEVPHIATPHCACSPKVTPQPLPDDTYKWLYVHNRVDGVTN